MVSEKYSKACKEVLQYLKGIRKEDIEKIPDKVIKFLEENADKKYECNFDYTKSLSELEVLNETKTLILIICLNYWCDSDEEKKELLKILNENGKNYQKLLRDKYNPDKIFSENDEDKNLKKNKLMQIKKDNVFRRFFEKIKEKITSVLKGKENKEEKEEK